MCEPPPEAVKQSDGSYVLTNEDGTKSRFTKRPDGSWRKPERVRAGWVGDLERKKYVPGEGIDPPNVSTACARNRNSSGPSDSFRDSNDQCRVMLQAAQRCLDQDKNAIKAMQEAEAAKAAERAEAARVEAIDTQWEAVTVMLGARPFGLVPMPESENNTGYTVLRATEGKPAWAEGVRPGWRITTVGGQDVVGLPAAEVQAQMKDSAVPLELGFTRPPAEWQFCVACMRPQPPVAFSRKMLTKPVDKRRCASCLQEAS